MATVDLIGPSNPVFVQAGGTKSILVGAIGGGALNIGRSFYWAVFVVPAPTTPSAGAFNLEVTRTIVEGIGPGPAPTNLRYVVRNNAAQDLSFVRFLIRVRP